MARGKEGREEASGRVIERGREGAREEGFKGAREQGREGNFKGGILMRALARCIGPNMEPGRSR